MNRCMRKVGFLAVKNTGQFSGLNVSFDENWQFKGDVDENLGYYWEAMPGLAQKRWFARELYNIHELGLESLNKLNMNLLSRSQRKQKAISNICNYRILENQEYADAMCYFHMERRNEEWKTRMSDKIC